MYFSILLAFLSILTSLDNHKIPYKKPKNKCKYRLGRNERSLYAWGQFMFFQTNLTIAKYFWEVKDLLLQNNKNSNI